MDGRTGKWLRPWYGYPSRVPWAAGQMEAWLTLLPRVTPKWAIFSLFSYQSVATHAETVYNTAGHTLKPFLIPATGFRAGKPPMFR